MALTNYSDLKTTIANYLARSDLTNQIPDFITLAEKRICRDLRIRQMLVVATAETTGNDATLGIPTDFLEMRDVHLQTTPRTSLKYLSPNAFYANARVTDVSLPVNYTVLASEIQFAPIPDTAYSVQMLYYAQPPLLSDTNSSNMLLANCPDLLLYAALGEAEPYLMNDARLQTWAALYERSMNSINVSDQAGEYGGQPMTMFFS